MITMAKNSAEAFDEFIKNAEVIVPLQARMSVPGGEDPADPTPEPDVVDIVNEAYKKE